MAAPNTNFSDSFIATTIGRWTSEVLFDQVFEKTPVFAWLKQNQDPMPNGLKLYEPLQYAQSTTAGAFAKADTFTAADREIATIAEYNWMQYQDTLAIFTVDLKKCNGDAQKVNLLKAKMANVQLSLTDVINADLWQSSGTGTGKQIIPLPTMIDATSTIGNLNSTTYSWWQAQVNSTSEALSTTAMANMYNSCGKGKAGEKPDLIVTTQTLYEAYEEMVLPYLRISSTKLGDLGFEGFKYKNAELTWDENCTSQAMYFLNSKVLKLRPHTDCAGKFMQEDGKPTNQLSHVYIVWWMGALTCSRRSSLGKLTSKTAP